MENDKALMIPPKEILAKGQGMAQALTQVVNGKKKQIKFNGEQYLEYEDWQTLGQFFGYCVRTGDAEPIQLGDVTGFKARASLIESETGLEVGGAEAYCMRDEPNWSSKPSFQLASMAQTRAGAKALRNRLAWVAVLAGYKPTPAEEMDGVFKEADDHTNDPYWCHEHQTKWFKKGAMKGYAHPLEGGGWCNMPSEGTSRPGGAGRELAENEEIVFDLWTQLGWVATNAKQAKKDLKEFTGLGDKSKAKETLHELDDMEMAAYIRHLEEQIA